MASGGQGARRSKRLLSKEEGWSTQGDRDFWDTVGNPVDIERSQTTTVKQRTTNDTQIPELTVNANMDLPQDLTNYTSSTPPDTRMTFLDETPTRNSPPRGTENVSKLSSIYMQPTTMDANVTRDAEILQRYLTDNYEELLDHKQQEQTQDE